MAPFIHNQVNNNRLVRNTFSCMSELFESMEGTWKLYRTLNQSGLMYGKVTFTKIGNGLLYRCQEEGIAVVKGKSYKAYKTYSYTYKDSKILIYAWNQKTQQDSLLHILEFPGYILDQWPLNSYSTYNCKKDTYNLHFIFYHANSFALNYKIVGPCKDYIIKTKIFRE